MRIKEERPLVSMFKKTECCRNEGVLSHEFKCIKDKYVPIKYETPYTSKYCKNGYSIRYVRKSDVLNYNG